MHRTSLKKKVRQYLFLFPKIRGDTQMDNHPRYTRQSVYKLMVLRSQSLQQDAINYNCKSVATVTARNMGDWASGIEYWKIISILITNYPLPITHYPLPILGAKIIGLLTL
ncbi:hypothetical protein CBP23_18475 [Fischerella thermalis WC344]|uniref:hypothetical protein n=1 Tax=Fischerella thermalis TaxID=372787 RepID=UPI000CBA4492|nr:hypothetical protein [Fischerella thermalis]PLZ59620.1 hypothetical protein CBP23_18475 [Fischerella thermalis WC344]